jgi:uncharacterized membrane protein
MLDVKLLVITGITLALGIYVFYSVFDSMPTLTNATDQAKVDAVKTNFGTAFTLAAIIGIVLGAVWIMRALNLF